MSNYWETFRTQRVARRRALQLSALGGAGLAALALVGCSGSSTKSARPDAVDDASSPQAHSTELAPTQVIRDRYTQEMLPFDPATLFRVNVERIAFNVYSGLTSYGSTDANPIPDVAASWEISDGGRVFTFKLNKGIKWHKGYGELTSEDVVYSYKRVMDPATASTYTSGFSKVDSVTAPDASTVVIKLKRPDANFFHQVANYHQGQIVNRKAIESLGRDYGFQPVGTGPFVFSKYVPGQQVVLDRFPEYFKGPATLEQVVLRRITDNETAAIAFQNEEVDILGSITNPPTFERLQADKRVTIRVTDKGTLVGNLIMNGGFKPLDDPRVRKALSHAIDRPTVLKAVAPINGKPWNTIIPSWMPEANPDVPTFPYDPQTAKQLLSAAGFPNGLSLKQLSTSASEEIQFYFDYWSKVGIKVEFEIVDEPTFVTRRLKSEFQIANRSIPAINPDDMLFGYFHSSQVTPVGYNCARLNIPEVDRLLESAQSEFDFQKRKADYFEAQALAMKEAPYIPTSNSKSIQIFFNWIDPVTMNLFAQNMYYPIKVYKRA